MVFADFNSLGPLIMLKSVVFSHKIHKKVGIMRFGLVIK